MPEAPNGVAAVIVLYHPDGSVADNIRATAAQVERVFVIDNTETPGREIADALIGMPNVDYAALCRNSGVAAALNIGIAAAEASGFGWVVTLDQDSTPTCDMVPSLVRCASECAAEPPIGVLAPMHQIENAPSPEPFGGCRADLTVITSGDLLRVESWKAVGGFDDDLFIDQVDHDFCLRLQLAGFFVGTCGSAEIAHRMGEMAEHRLLGPVFVSNHSPIRRYYITRNRLEMIRRYEMRFPEFAAAERRAQFHELLKVILFEGHRLSKLRMAFLGWLDYRRRRLGPFEERRRRDA